MSAAPPNLIHGSPRAGGADSPVRKALGMLAPFASLAIVIIFFYIIAPDRPATFMDLRTVAVHTVIVGLAAMGMTFIIISGGIDLSVGSAIALASVGAALTLDGGWQFAWLSNWGLVEANPARLLNAFGAAAPIPAALLTALAIGALCGLYNALLITGLRLPPFIATLGTLGFFRGVAKWLSGSVPVSPATTGGLG
ncbi:MAG: hypothetical protein AB1716_17085, partial [Planctomycetota bacterium]